MRGCSIENIPSKGMRVWQEQGGIKGEMRKGRRETPTRGVFPCQSG